MSNELITSTKENTISSREVAEMIGIRHDHMLDKIDKLNSILNNRNLGASKHLYETNSKDLATENYVAKLQYSIFHDNNDIDENILIYHAE